MRARIVFYSVTSEYNPAFVLLKLWFQLRILEMTDVHQRSKMDCSLLFLCLLDLLLAPYFWPFAMLAICRASPIPCPLLLWHPGFSFPGA